MFRILLLLGLSLGTTDIAIAQPVQKWVDDKGKVHYGAPPASGGSKQEMKGGTVSAPGAGKAGTTTRSAQKSTAGNQGTSAPAGGGRGGAFSEQARKDFAKEIDAAAQNGKVRR